MIPSLSFYGPVIGLSVLSLALFALDALVRRPAQEMRSFGFWIGLVGLALTATLIPGVPSEPQLFGRGMLVWDSLSYVVTWIGLLAAASIFLLSAGYRGYDNLRLAAYHGLVVLCTVGIVFVAMAQDFLMALVAIELVSLPLVVLCAYVRKDPAAKQAGMKFFLISAFSSAMLIYGLSILYGILGSTSFQAVKDGAAVLEANRTLSITAFLLVLVSFGFKIALVPFHVWVSDVFDGAPTPIAAFLSVAPKVAGAAVAFRVFSLMLDPGSLGMLMVLAVLAAVTMTVGNLLGLQQTNVIRLLAYSSVAHMGYLLIGLVAGGGYGLTGFYFYAAAYLFMNAGAFVVVMSLTQAMGSRDLSAFDGLGKRSPLLAGLLTLFLMSLAGIPPLAGFVAKFYVLSAAYKAGWLWLAAIGVLNTLIAAAYYFKILKAMYFNAPVQEDSLVLDKPLRVLLLVASAATLVVGLAPQTLLGPLQRLAGSTSVLEKGAVMDCCKVESAPTPTPEEKDHAPHEQ